MTRLAYHQTRSQNEGQWKGLHTRMPRSIWWLICDPISKPILAVLNHFRLRKSQSVWNAVPAGLLACNAVCSLKGNAVSHERVVRNYKTIPLIIASSACCKHVISLCTWHCWLGKPTTVGLGDREHLSMVCSACMAVYCRAFAWFPMALFLSLFLVKFNGQLFTGKLIVWRLIGHGERFWTG